MKKFELFSKDLQDFKKEKLEDLIYEIKGDEKLLKELIYRKIQPKCDFLYISEDEFIKKLEIYVTKGHSGIEMWLDFDEYNDLYPINMNCDFTIDNVFKIKNTFIDWLLG